MLISEHSLGQFQNFQNIIAPKYNYQFDSTIFSEVGQKAVCESWEINGVVKKSLNESKINCFCGPHLMSLTPDKAHRCRDDLVDMATDRRVELSREEFWKIATNGYKRKCRSLGGKYLFNFKIYEYLYMGSIIVEDQISPVHKSNSCFCPQGNVIENFMNEHDDNCSKRYASFEEENAKKIQESKDFTQHKSDNLDLNLELIRYKEFNDTKEKCNWVGGEFLYNGYCFCRENYRLSTILQGFIGHSKFLNYISSLSIQEAQPSEIYSIHNVAKAPYKNDLAGNRLNFCLETKKHILNYPAMGFYDQLDLKIECEDVEHSYEIKIGNTKKMKKFGTPMRTGRGCMCETGVSVNPFTLSCACHERGGVQGGSLFKALAFGSDPCLCDDGTEIDLSTPGSNCTNLSRNINDQQGLDLMGRDFWRGMYQVIFD